MGEISVMGVSLSVTVDRRGSMALGKRFPSPSNVDPKAKKVEEKTEPLREVKGDPVSLIQVEYSPKSPNVHALSHVVVLKPGINQVDGGIFDRASKNPSTAALIKDGVIKVVGAQSDAVAPVKKEAAPKEEPAKK
jgi:hypothetical protein